MMENFRGLSGLIIGRGEQDATYDEADLAEPQSAFNPGAGTFTAPVAGTYDVTYEINWNGPGFVRSTATILKNGSPTGLSDFNDFPPGGGQRLDGLVNLKRGDEIKAHVSYEVQDFQNPVAQASQGRLMIKFDSP